MRMTHRICIDVKTKEAHDKLISDAFDRGMGISRYVRTKLGLQKLSKKSDDDSR